MCADGSRLETTNRAIPVELDELASTSDARTSTDDDSVDIFRADFDDFSTRRSQSASFPRIRFANSSGSDEESDSESDSSDVTESRSSPKPRGRPMSVQKPSMTNSTDMSLDDSPIQRTLFIQMEFVEKVRETCSGYVLTCSKHFARSSRTALMRMRDGSTCCKSYKHWHICRRLELCIAISNRLTS